MVAEIPPTHAVEQMEVQCEEICQSSQKHKKD